MIENSPLHHTYPGPFYYRCYFTGVLRKRISNCSGVRHSIQFPPFILDPKGPPGSTDRWREYGLHPGLLDGALQALLTLAGATELHVSRVPLPSFPPPFAVLHILRHRPWAILMKMGTKVYARPYNSKCQKNISGQSVNPTCGRR